MSIDSFTLVEFLKKRKFKICFLAEELYRIMGEENPETAGRKISLLKKQGWTYKGASSSGRDDKYFSILFYALGVPEDYHSVRTLKKMSLYPPKNGIPYKELLKRKNTK